MSFETKVQLALAKIKSLLTEAKELMTEEQTKVYIVLLANVINVQVFSMVERCDDAQDFVDLVDCLRKLYDTQIGNR